MTVSLNRNQLVYKICRDLQWGLIPFSAAMANSISNSLLVKTYQKGNWAVSENQCSHRDQEVAPSLRAWWSTSVDINGKILLFERTTDLDHYSEGKVTVIKSPTPFLMFSLEIGAVRPSESDHVLGRWTDSVWLFGTTLACSSCCLILDCVGAFMTEC